MMRHHLFAVLSAISLLLFPVSFVVLQPSHVYVNPGSGYDIIWFLWWETDPLPRWISVSLPLTVWCVFLVLPVAWVADWGRRLRVRMLATRRRNSGLCPTCGYDLRASKERCPECGSSSAKSAESCSRTRNA